MMSGSISEDYPQSTSSERVLQSKLSIRRLHIDSVTWNGEPIAVNNRICRIYYSSFILIKNNDARSSWSVGDFCRCDGEVYRIVGAFQATASFVGEWDHWPQEIQKQGHPYILVVPLTFLDDEQQELGLPICSNTFTDDHVDVLPQWLGDPKIRDMQKLSVCVVPAGQINSNRTKKSNFKSSEEDSKCNYTCSHSIVLSNTRKRPLRVQPLTDYQYSLLTSEPRDLQAHHLPIEWNTVFRAERVRLSYRKRPVSSRFPVYYTEESSDDESINEVQKDDSESNEGIRGSSLSKANKSKQGKVEKTNHVFNAAKLPHEGEKSTSNVQSLVNLSEGEREMIFTDAVSIDDHNSMKRKVSSKKSNHVRRSEAVEDIHNNIDKLLVQNGGVKSKSNKGSYGTVKSDVEGCRFDKRTYDSTVDRRVTPLANSFPCSSDNVTSKYDHIENLVDGEERKSNKAKDIGETNIAMMDYDNNREDELQSKGKESTSIFRSSDKEAYDTIAMGNAKTSFASSANEVKLVSKQSNMVDREGGERQVISDKANQHEEHKTLKSTNNNQRDRLKQVGSKWKSNATGYFKSSGNIESCKSDKEHNDSILESEANMDFPPNSYNCIDTHSADIIQAVDQENLEGYLSMSNSLPSDASGVGEDGNSPNTNISVELIEANGKEHLDLCYSMSDPSWSLDLENSDCSWKADDQPNCSGRDETRQIDKGNSCGSPINSRGKTQVNQSVSSVELVRAGDCSSSASSDPCSLEGCTFESQHSQSFTATSLIGRHDTEIPKSEISPPLLGGSSGSRLAGNSSLAVCEISPISHCGSNPSISFRSNASSLSSQMLLGGIDDDTDSGDRNGNSNKSNNSDDTKQRLCSGTKTLATTMTNDYSTMLIRQRRRILDSDEIRRLRTAAKARKSKRFDFFNSKDGRQLRLNVIHHGLRHCPGEPQRCIVCGHLNRETNKRNGRRTSFRCRTCGDVPLCTRNFPGRAESCWTEFHTKHTLEKRYLSRNNSSGGEKDSVQPQNEDLASSNKSSNSSSNQYYLRGKGTSRQSAERDQHAFKPSSKPTRGDRQRKESRKRPDWGGEESPSRRSKSGSSDEGTEHNKGPKQYTKRRCRNRKDGLLGDILPIIANKRERKQAKQYRVESWTSQ